MKSVHFYYIGCLVVERNSRTNIEEERKRERNKNQSAWMNRAHKLNCSLLTCSHIHIIIYEMMIVENGKLLGLVVCYNLNLDVKVEVVVVV